MTVPSTSPSDHVYWLRRAIDLSRKCPPSSSAYNVGAVIVDADGAEIATGFSRETDPHIHAEESALDKLHPDDPRLSAATLYSTLEPCSERQSRRLPCAALTVQVKIPRVVIAWREPGHFVVDCQGVEQLQQAGVEVVEITELASEAMAVNARVLSGTPE